MIRSWFYQLRRWALRRLRGEAIPDPIVWPAGPGVIYVVTHRYVRARLTPKQARVLAMKLFSVAGPSFGAVPDPDDGPDEPTAYTATMATNPN